MGQFNKTVKILEGARNKLIDMRDNWFPVGSSFSMELDEFVMDKLRNHRRMMNGQIQ